MFKYTPGPGTTAIVVVFFVAAVIALNFALSIFGAYLGVELIGGHDISFREAVGIAVLLFLAKS